MNMKTFNHSGILLSFLIIYSLHITDAQISNTRYNCVTNNGERGMCKLLKKCSSAFSLYYEQNISATLCGYSNGQSVACCTDIRLLLKPALFYSHPGMRISEKKCRQYTAEKHKIRLIDRELKDSMHCRGSICFRNTPDTYQIQTVGGEAAKTNEFPHMAQIGWETNNNSIEFICGGFIISEKYILTAAHCMYSDDTRYKGSLPSHIRIGDSDPKYIEIAECLPHEKFEAPIKYNDIGLIKLKKSIKFDLDILPACLWANSTFESQATTIGYGQLSKSGPFPDRLQKVKLDIYNDSVCREGYPVSRKLPDGIISSQFCAGYHLGGKDSCQGDSGGPIQVEDKFNKGIFHIIGITSFGKGCGTKDGGVYTRISHYIDWIEKNVWPND